MMSAAFARLMSIGLSCAGTKPAARASIVYSPAWASTGVKLYAVMPACQTARCGAAVGSVNIDPMVYGAAFVWQF